jgi:hypothetical protein
MRPTRRVKEDWKAPSLADRRQYRSTERKVALGLVPATPGRETRAPKGSTIPPRVPATRIELLKRLRVRGSGRTEAIAPAPNSGAAWLESLNDE